MVNEETIFHLLSFTQPVENKRHWNCYNFIYQMILLPKSIWLSDVFCKRKEKDKIISTLFSTARTTLHKAVATALDFNCPIFIINNRLISYIFLQALHLPSHFYHTFNAMLAVYRAQKRTWILVCPWDKYFCSKFCLLWASLLCNCVQYLHYILQGQEIKFKTCGIEAWPFTIKVREDLVFNCLWVNYKTDKQ